MAWAPSSSTLRPASSASWTRPTASPTMGVIRAAYSPRYSSQIAAASMGRRLYTLASTAFFSFNTTSSFWRKILASSRSCTRSPTRAALSA